MIDHEAIALLEEALARFGDEDHLLAVQLRAAAGRLAALRERRGAHARRSAPRRSRWRSGSATRARCWPRWRAGTPRCCTSTTSTSGCGSSEELLALAARIGERELEALGHHWRIYDLLEAGRRSRPRGARTAALATLAAELRQPLYHHFAVGWEVVWAQMAGRVGDAERLAREAYELGRRAQARDAETIYAAQLLILRRREDALGGVRLDDRAATSSATPRCVAWRAILPMAHLMTGDTQAGVAQFRELAQDEFAAIPRDMFWFTAIALLGETCALLGDARAGAGPLPAARAAPRAAGAGHARPRASAPRSASSRCWPPRRATSTPPSATSSAGLERNAPAGCGRSWR